LELTNLALVKFGGLVQPVAVMLMFSALVAFKPTANSCLALITLMARFFAVLRLAFPRKSVPVGSEKVNTFPLKS
jgi:hypothetical protein